MEISLIHRKHTFCKYGRVCPFFSQSDVISRAKKSLGTFLSRKKSGDFFVSKKVWGLFWPPPPSAPAPPPTMTSRKNRDTSSAIVRTVCARCSCARSAVGWVHCFLSKDPVAPWSRFTAAWDHLIYGGHIVYHTSPFCFSMRSYHRNCKGC